MIAWTSHRVVSKPYKVQQQWGIFWITLKRTRTIQGAVAASRSLDSKPGRYRIVSPNEPVYVWRNQSVEEL